MTKNDNFLYIGGMVALIWSIAASNVPMAVAGWILMITADE